MRTLPLQSGERYGTLQSQSGERYENLTFPEWRTLSEIYIYRVVNVMNT